MVHKSSIIPGVSRFIDECVLSHYPPTSMKRILMAGAVSLYLKKNEGIVDTLVSNPLFSSLGIFNSEGMVDLESLRDTLKSEINKAGFMRLTIPMVGDVDFTTDDVDTLYKFIVESNTSVQQNATVPTQRSLITNTTSINVNNEGIY